MNGPAQNPEAFLERFGLVAFRPGQRQVIETVLSGRDTLCIMPTGGGKSLCYQLPTIARDGVTIVVSPLIALMKDQVDSMSRLGIPATLINSTLTSTEQYERIDAMTRGTYKLVYIAPERLRSASFMKAVQDTNIQLLAVDEAHCISQWGHDFRPDYSRLGRFREMIGQPQTVALTATATEIVRSDILKILDLTEPQTFVTGFARENLFLKVDSPSSNSEKDAKLTEFLQNTEGCGIIYASTRKNCEQLIELLDRNLKKRKVAFYHAGLTTEKRREVQEKFMSGEIPIIVATNAFGMGIDKADLRFVVHYNMPGSLEAYYQEAGRAGRDGLPSECMLLYSFQDRFIQEFFVENSYPSRETVKDVYEYLRSIDADPIEMTLQEIKEELGLSLGTTGIANCENLLERANAIERMNSQDNMAAIRIDSELPTLIDMVPRDAKVRRHVLKGLEEVVGPLRGERVMFRPERLAEQLEMKWSAVARAIRELTKLEMLDYVPPFRGRAIHLLSREKSFDDLNIDFQELEKRKRAELDKLQRVIRFATSRRCRQLEILDYFGDPDSQKCNNCDNCGPARKKEFKKPAHADADACLFAAQVALSGITKTKGRFGKKLIAQMLTGSTAKKLSQMGLARQSTFGMLSALRQVDAVALIDWLIENGYATQTESAKFRPVVQITNAGKVLMAGKDRIDLSDYLPAHLISKLSTYLRGKTPHRPPDEATSKASPPKSSASKAVDDADSARPDTLEDKTSDLKAQEQFSLVEPEPSLAQTSPPLKGSTAKTANSPDNDALGSRAEPTEISSTAAKPVATFSNSSTLNEETDRGETPSPFTVGPPKFTEHKTLTSDETEKTDCYWTWKLFTDGYSAAEIEQIRRLEGETIGLHLLKAMEMGLNCQPTWLLDANDLQLISQWLEDHDDNSETIARADLQHPVSAEKMAYFLKIRHKTSQKRRTDI